MGGFAMGLDDWIDTIKDTWNDNSEDKSGCCKFNQVIKCSGKALVRYGNDLKDLSGQAFQNGCEAIGGTVDSNDKWECDVEGETGMQKYYGQLVNGSGSISTNVNFMSMMLMVFFMMFLTRMLFGKMCA